MEDKDKLDINENLGSFGEEKNENLNVAEEKKQNQEPKEIKDEKINFDKFDINKKNLTASKLTVKMDMWLRNKKSLTIIWLTILAVIVFILVSQICFPIFNESKIHHLSAGPKKLLKDVEQASSILSYISLSLIPPTFLFLLTTWIVGINGVYKSVVFHKFLWFCLLVSVICAVSSIICGSIFQYEANSWHPPWS